MVDIRQTSEYAVYLKQIGWIVERIDNVNYAIKKLPIIGSVIKIQRPKKINYEVIKRLSGKYRAFQVILEPSAASNTFHIKNIIAERYRLSQSPYLPTRTLLLGLTKSKDQLFKEMKKDCRYAIKKNNELRIRKYELASIEEFRNTWKKAVGWKRHVPSLSHLGTLKKSFKDHSLFAAATYSNDSNRRSDIVGGAIFLMGDNIGYYWQAFTNREGRKSQVQYKIVWEGILWAKKMGAKVFDFEGIYDERFPNKTWLGFSHFKKSFGGYEVEYPGTFIKNRVPF